MKIETKYNIGQIVYFMYKNAVCKMKIGNIEIKVTEGEIAYIIYEGEITNQESYKKSETFFFESKEELLESL